MESKTYKNDELCQMSYQELRRISILLKLPANIKKKHMISMIEAHQKGDGQTKTEIANKIMEERNLRKMNTQVKQGKQFILSSRVRTQQVSTDLSVATKHEFETCYSYVAHYTNKRNKGSGMMREETEVPRRNRSAVQPAAKSTRKMAPVGKTEIMLPRNHSLTSLVQLMPQHDRTFIPSCKGTRVLTSETNWNSGSNYESTSTSPSTTEYHYQGGGQFVYGNLPFHPDYSSSFIASTSHEMYRSLPYWHPGELYNSVIPGNLIIPMLPNMLNSEGSTSHPSSPASVNLSSEAGFPQRHGESFIKCNGNDRGVYDSENNGGLINVYAHEDVNSDNPTKTVANTKIPEPSYDYNRRSELLRHGDNQPNENLTYLVDIFAPRGVAQTSEQVFTRNMSSSRNSDSGNQIIYPLIKPRTQEEIEENMRANEDHIIVDVQDESYHEGEYEEGENASEESTNPDGDNYVASNPETSVPRNKFENEEDVEEEEEMEEEEEEENNEDAPQDWRFRFQSGHHEHTVLPSFVSAFHEMRSPESAAPETCVDSSRMSPGEVDGTDHDGHGNAISVTMSNFSQCRYISGHNHFPESTFKPYFTPDSAPLFPCNLEKTGQDCAYSLCKNISTETTAVHLQPIMTIPNSNRSEDERTWNECEMTSNQTAQEVISNNNAGNLYNHHRPMFYSYPENHSPYTVDSSAHPNWYECSEGLESKMTQNNRHDVRLVQCKRHGYHYFYTLPSTQ